MLLTLLLGLVAAFVNTAAAANEVVRDPDTGLTFTSNYQLYKVNAGITFRVAIPDDAQSYSPYDAVVQLVVPNEVGWVGLAWGGGMTNNPLVVAWNSGNSVTLSPRWATGHTMPTPSSTAGTYTLFQTGTKNNGTHWQFTALCKGCTSWTPSSGSTRYLSPTGGNRLAFGYSSTRPSGGADGSITIHQVHGYWTHDFAGARNANFHDIVQTLSV